MASFEAKVRVLLDAQEAYRELDKFEKKVAKVRDSRTQKQLNNIAQERRAIVDATVKGTSKQLDKSLRLAAVEQRRLRLVKNLQRSGALGRTSEGTPTAQRAANKERAETILSALRAGEAAKDNLRVQQAVVNLLSKELEFRNEINRSEKAQAAVARKNTARGGDFERRVELLRAAGAAEKDLKKIETERAELGTLNSKKQTDLARIQLDVVEDLIKAQERLFKPIINARTGASSPVSGRADIPGSPAAIRANAVRSPIRGGVNFPGSPNYLKEQARLAKKAKTEFEKLNKEVIKNAVSSPVRGGANFPGSPDFLKQQANNAKKSRRQGFGQFERLLTGAGFPLLFGGGPGAVAGGALGGVFDALSGTTFGFSIALGALGQALDGALNSATELGQALNPLSLDLERVAQAAGLAGTSTETLLKKVEEVRGAFVAAELAGEQLAVVIGQNGVDSLEALGDSATNLGNEASKAFTALSAALAPALTAVNDFLASSIKRSRLLSRGSGEFRDDEQIQNIRSRFQNRELGEIETEDLIIKRVQELEAAEKKAADTRLRGTLNAARAAEDIVRIKESELVISQLNNDILNDRVFKEEENILRLKAATEEKKLYLQFARDEITLAALRNKLDANNLDLKKALNDLQIKRADAQADRDAKLAREAAAAERERLQILSKRLQLENQIAQTLLRQNQEIIRGVEAQIGPLAAARLEQQNQSVVLEQRLLEIERQRNLASQQKNADIGLINQLAQTQIDLANEEYNTARLITDQKIRQIEAEREITRLQSDRNVTALSRDLGREQENITASLAAAGNSDLQQQLELQIRQQRRYDDALRGSAELIEELRVRRRGETQEQQALTDQQISNEQKKIEIYKQQLPVLNELEQQQLKFNQTYAKVKPVVDEVVGGLLNGIQAVVAGTKTAEEAFADFLNSIAQLLLKTAAEMIATYIAIGIAKQFAGMGGGIKPGNFNGNAVTSSNTATAFNGTSLLEGLETGGRTMANMPYVVGEKGAELFVPGKTGTMVPADVFEATRQAIAGNGPEGGDSDAFAQNSIALGNTATTTKENTLVREMSMRGNEAIDIRYDATVINDVSYVSEEQFQAGLKAAVAQSKASMFRDLKNKPSARAGIGI